MTTGATRRNFLMSGAAAGAAGGFGCGPGIPTGADIYSKLGIRTLINGIGTVTVLGGSLMPPEVIRAMEEAARHFIPLMELQQKAGDYVAKLIGVPAAMVTAGAASAITVATEACVTRGDSDKLRRLPDTTGMKNEIIIQKTHRGGYEPQMLLVGTKIIWVETREELEAALNDRTAMMAFLNLKDPVGQIKSDEWISVAKQHGVPTFNDAAADVPPASHLSDYVKQGFDLVAFSGGKGLQGPQCTGLLVGRKDLVSAARKGISPHGGIGRNMKVGKEEIAGLVAAVERYVKLDHDAEKRKLEDRCNYILKQLADLPGIQCSIFVPEIANHVPHVAIRWNESKRKPTSKEVVDRLMEGDPPIAISRRGEGALRISVWMMQDDEHHLVADRLRELLGQTT